MACMDDKLNLIKSLTDEQEAFFTLKRQIVINYIKKGYSASKIIALVGCSRQNMYAMINHIYKAICDGFPKKEHKDRRYNDQSEKKNYPSRCHIIIDGDLSILTPREKRVVDLYNMGYKYKDIADQLGIKTCTVNAHINRARKRISGDFDKERSKDNARRKKYLESHKEQCRAYHNMYCEKNKDQLREWRKNYNKRYYEKNKVKILENRKRKIENKR